MVSLPPTRVSACCGVGCMLMHTEFECWSGYGCNKFAMHQQADNRRTSVTIWDPPSMSAWFSKAWRGSAVTPAETAPHLGLTRPYDIWIIAFQRAGGALTAAGVEVISGWDNARHRRTHIHSLDFRPCPLCSPVGRHGGGMRTEKTVAASAAHEYSGCKLLQLFLSSNRGKLLPSPSPSSAFTLSQQIWPPPDER